MAGVTLQLKGLDKLERKFGALRGGKYIADILKNGAKMLKNEIAVYPALSNANEVKQPGGGSWYQRGYGTRYARKDGSFGGRKTSQVLSKHWTISADSKRAVIGNNVTYAPFVQSAERQAAIHAQRGWITDEKAMEKAKPAILRMVKQRIEELLSK